MILLLDHGDLQMNHVSMMVSKTHLKQVLDKLDSLKLELLRLRQRFYHKKS